MFHRLGLQTDKPVGAERAIRRLKAQIIKGDDRIVTGLRQKICQVAEEKSRASERKNGLLKCC